MTLPLFIATHPRACSTAFERAFMTRRGSLKTVHEPFGDAWYFGPERLADRYADDAESREESGFSQSTYHTIMERINTDNIEGKRLFIKDMAQYLFPPNHRPVALAPSLLDFKRGVGTSEEDLTKKTENGAHFETKSHLDSSAPVSRPVSAAAPYQTFTELVNPTVVPTDLLEQFHFAFLIRHPRYAIPSYYRCCIPPLEEMTGFHNFRPDEAGYDELKRLFDYLRMTGQIGPNIAGRPPVDDGAFELNSPDGGSPTNGSPTRTPINGHSANGHSSSNGNLSNGTDRLSNGKKRPKVEICVIDADDLLDNPQRVMEAFCTSIGVPFKPEMLVWDTEEHQRFAAEAFEKWKGFHEDAINSTDLHARENKRVKTDEELYAEWTSKYGEKGARVIAETVKACTPDYEYLKRFALQV